MAFNAAKLVNDIVKTAGFKEGRVQKETRRAGTPIGKRASSTGTPVKTSGTPPAKTPKVVSKKAVASSNTKVKARNAFLNRGSGTLAQFEKLWTKAQAGKSTGAGESATRRASGKSTSTAALKKARSAARTKSGGKRSKKVRRITRRLNRRS